MSVLPDSSVWVDYLRDSGNGRGSALGPLLEQGEAVVCGPVMAELVSGTDPEDRDSLWLALASHPWADLDRTAWRKVGETANDLRRRGKSLPLTDVVIAIAAVESVADLWTRDRDFERIQEVLPELVLVTP